MRCAVHVAGGFRGGVQRGIFFTRCAHGMRRTAALREGGGQDVPALVEKTEIGAVDVRGVGLEDVVGEEDVGDLVLGHVGLHVFGEVARVDDVNLGEGVEEIAG